jgi:hypothetical protein
MPHQVCAIAAVAWVLAASAGCVSGGLPPEQPDGRGVTLTLGDEAAVWRFIPIDVLPGGLDATLDELPPPPPPPLSR